MAAEKTNSKIDPQAKNWLVKSSSRILGPFTVVEIADLLVKQHISVIDEVRQPRGRWRYIRETGIFSDVVKNLRHEIDLASDKTVSNMGGGTQTISKTDWSTTPRGGDQTPTPRVDPDSPYAFATIVKDVTPTGRGQGGFSSDSRGEASFGSLSDHRVYDQLKEKNKTVNFLFWAFTFFMAAAIITYGFRKVNGPKASYQQLIEKALHYKHIQLYDKALDAYKKSQEIRDPDPAVAFQMALVMIHAEKQSLQARRILQQGLNDEFLSNGDKVDAFVGIGLSYGLEGDIKMAQEYFNRALGYDPQFIPAQINLAYNEIRKGDYGASLSIFKALPASKTFFSDILFGRAVWTAEFKKSTDQAIKSELQQQLVTTAPLRKELALMLSYLHYLDQDEAALTQTMQTLIDIPLGESKDFARDLRIDGRIADWDYLEKYCAEIYANSSGSSLTKAFRSICLLEQNRDAEAQKIIDEALAENPRDPYVKMTQAHFLMKKSRHEEAATVLKVPALESFTSVQLLQGRNCLKSNDDTCAESQFRLAYRQNSEDVSRLAELAAWMIKKGNVKEGGELIRAGLQEHPNYKPLIALRDKLENP